MTGPLSPQPPASAPPESRAPRERELQVIFENIADAVLVQDTSYRCVFANLAGAQLCGYASTEEFLRATVPEILDRFEILTEDGSPFPIDRLPARLALLGVKSAAPSIMQSRNKRTGKVIWSSVTSRPILDGNDQPYLAVSIFRDVTREIQSRENLAFLSEASMILSSSLDYNDTLRRVAEIAASRLCDWCSIAIVERTGPVTVTITHADPTMKKVAEDFRVRYPADWSPKSGAARVLVSGRPELHPVITDEVLVAAARDPEHLRMMRELKLRSAMVVPIHGREQVLGVLTLVSARDERRYAEADLRIAEELAHRAGLAIDNARLFAQAQEAIRVRDEFLSIASHELKTPLTVLKLQAEINRRQYAKDSSEPTGQSSLLKMFDASMKQVARLSKLVDDMLDISRIAHGKLSLEPHETELGAFVREVIERFKEQLSAAGCSCTLQAEPELRVSLDRDRMEQVVINLLTNAMKYGAGKPVEVSVVAEGGSALLRIADHGVGVEKSDQERIFQRFERASSAHHMGGLGLGLYISRQIVEGHGGRLSVESEPGHGSVFTVELPRR